MSNDHTSNERFDRNLKRKVMGALGIVGALWGVVAAVVMGNPDLANTAFMAAVSGTSVVVAIIGSE